MSEVRRVARKAGSRLALIDMFRVLAVVLTAALALILLTRIVERSFGLGDTFAAVWPKVWIWTPVGVLLATLIATYARLKKTGAVAQELDERAGLKEALSTALYIEKAQDPWSQNMLTEAQRIAVGVKVNRAIPMEAPRLWPVPVFTGLALAIAWFAMPNLDLLGVTEKKVAEVKKNEAVQAVKADIQTKENELKKMLEKAKVTMTDETGEAEGQEQKPEANDPDAMRRAAVKKLTVLTEKLETEKEGEKAAQAEAIKEAMKQLKQPGQGPLNDFTKALAKGDFNKASEMLKQIENQMADGSMSPEDQAQTKKQMENLAKQLEKAGQEQQQLQKKLEEQGLDKKTAEDVAKKAASSNPDELKKALEQMKNMSEEQKKQLMEMAKAAQKAQGQCQNMSQAMSKAAQGMTQQGLQQEGMEGMEQLATELSEAEMMQNDMQNLDAALEEAKKQLADMAGECMGGDCEGEGQGMGKGKTGKFREGTSRAQGNGTGGPGQGNGASPESQATDYTTEKVKANVNNTGGPIIGSRLVYGEQVRGESVAEFSSVVESSTAEAAEALEGQTIPREYHDAVKTYFGRLQEKVKKDKGEAKPVTPAPAAPAAPK